MMRLPEPVLHLSQMLAEALGLTIMRLGIRTYLALTPENVRVTITIEDDEDDAPHELAPGVDPVHVEWLEGIYSESPEDEPQPE